MVRQPRLDRPPRKGLAAALGATALVMTACLGHTAHVDKAAKGDAMRAAISRRLPSGSAITSLTLEPGAGLSKDVRLALALKSTSDETAHDLLHQTLARSMPAVFLQRDVEVRTVYVAATCGSDLFWSGVLTDFDASRFHPSSEAQAEQLDWERRFTTTFQRSSPC